MTTINMIRPKATLKIWIDNIPYYYWSIFDCAKMKMLVWGYFTNKDQIKSWDICLDKNFNAYENFMARMSRHG